MKRMMWSNLAWVDDVIKSRAALIAVAIVGTTACQADVTSHPPVAGVPAPAASAGYPIHTFASDADFGAKNVDMGLTGAAGFQWYVFNFFGYRPSSALTTFNADGSVTIAQYPGRGPDTNLASAASIPSAPHYRGTAFGGGGYFEATLAWDHATVDEVGAWPAWWTMSLEHMAGLPGRLWPGQGANYEHFVEPDIVEDDLGKSYKNAYGGNVHDWYGQLETTCPHHVFCDIDLPFMAVVRTVPAGTDFNAWHRYGFLWIPATSAKAGSISYWFDGVRVGLTTIYYRLPPRATPPAGAPWTFSVIDDQHLVLILGTGASTPLRVRDVDVWQASAAGNLHN